MRTAGTQLMTWRFWTLCLALATAATAAAAASGAGRGRLYVPIYSSIPAGSGATRIDLAATLSVRNLSARTPLTIERCDYRDGAGKLVRAQIAAPVTIPPLGGFEAVIADKDIAGGVGAKFLVDWSAPAGAPEPLAEAVMIGTYGSMGFSFVSVGRAAPRED